LSVFSSIQSPFVDAKVELLNFFIGIIIDFGERPEQI